jgi:hypothetical protein
MFDSSTDTSTHFLNIELVKKMQPCVIKRYSVRHFKMAL